MKRELFEKYRTEFYQVYDFHKDYDQLVKDLKAFCKIHLIFAEISIEDNIREINEETLEIDYELWVFFNFESEYSVSVNGHTISELYEILQTELLKYKRHLDNIETEKVLQKHGFSSDKKRSEL